MPMFLQFENIYPFTLWFILIITIHKISILLIKRSDIREIVTDAGLKPSMCFLIV